MAALAVAALTAAGCSSGTSGSGTASGGGTPAAGPGSSAPPGGGTGSVPATGGAGSASVTSYLSYTGGKPGRANSALPPVYIGWINQQGGQQSIGPLATAGAQMAVRYVNAELGGVGGHPVALKTCFIASAEEEGTTCGQQMAANKSVSVVAMGGVAIGVQSFYSTIGTSKPVIDGVAATPIDAVRPNSVILFGDATGRSGPTPGTSCTPRRRRWSTRTSRGSPRAPPRSPRGSRRSA
jgi:branched-chain amino acid transport system substrate-binding protein